jgi:hypothetical protein
MDLQVGKEAMPAYGNSKTKLKGRITVPWLIARSKGGNSCIVLCDGFPRSRCTMTTDLDQHVQTTTSRNNDLANAFATLGDDRNTRPLSQKSEIEFALEADGNVDFTQAGYALA